MHPFPVPSFRNVLNDQHQIEFITTISQTKFDLVLRLVFFKWDFVTNYRFTSVFSSGCLHSKHTCLIKLNNVLLKSSQQLFFGNFQFDKFYLLVSMKKHDKFFLHKYTLKKFVMFETCPCKRHVKENVTIEYGISTQSS